eukprot:scaffold101702_cov87-Phaeocystis_antarctica.AAC.1
MQLSVDGLSIACRFVVADRPAGAAPRPRVAPGLCLRSTFVSPAPSLPTGGLGGYILPIV